MKIVKIFDTEDTQLKAHGFYKYESKKYIVLTADKNLPYKTLEGWLALFDTKYGVHIANELDQESIGQYWYLAPEDDLINQELELFGSDEYWYKPLLQHEAPFSYGRVSNPSLVETKI